MKRTDVSNAIAWREWSEESFKEAKKNGKLVLLDLTASWCHWCHVMDEKTYSNPEIALAISEHFVPVRVDIDRRPDISERYNRGGFPTTAFLSDQGESIWGATYVPPNDMKRIMEGILKAQESGEIGRALERSRNQILQLAKPLTATRGPVDSAQLQKVFEDIFDAYDATYGGFGVEPKFPHPDVLDVLLTRYAETADEQLADAVHHTLECMVSGLRDKVEGGVFRYSVTRDWRTPHFEKMLETNVGFLRNLTQALGIIGDRGYDAEAKDIARYLKTTLQDAETGGFYGSQDADEEYYKLGESARKRKSSPSIDRTVYAGWNAEASAAFTMSGIVFRDEGMLSAGEASWNYMIRHLWNSRLGLVKHTASEEIYLFEDQVSFFRALLAQLGVNKDAAKVAMGEQLIGGVDKAFANPDGGFSDITKVEDAIGELDTPRRPLVENSNWALELARFGTAIHRFDLVSEARLVLDSFTIPELDAHGVFAAAYLRARWAFGRGFSAVEIHQKARTKASENTFLAAVQVFFDPSIVPTTIVDDNLTEPYSMVCNAEGCSRKTKDPDELATLLRDIRAENRPRTAVR